jgi:LAO/AO transport system kinase
MWQQLLQEIQLGNIKSLARAISLVENEFAGYESFAKFATINNKNYWHY